MKDFKASKKANKSRPQKKDPPAPIPEIATTEDPPMDAPLYDTTPFTAGVALNQEYSQNFDHSGFIPLCQETYTTLQGLNPRLTRDMPFPGFFHNMNTILQVAIIDSVYEDGQRPVPNYSSRAQEILPDNYVIPGPIYEYVTNISTIITPGGQEVKPNLPPSTIPQPPDEDEGIPAGTFGAITAENHNVYETHLCPYTTMTYVTESAQHERPNDWEPLPPGLVPEGGILTRDFLGYLELH